MASVIIYRARTSPCVALIPPHDLPRPLITLAMLLATDGAMCYISFTGRHNITTISWQIVKALRRSWIIRASATRMMCINEWNRTQVEFRGCSHELACRTSVSRGGDVMHVRRKQRVSLLGRQSTSICRRLNHITSHACHSKCRSGSGRRRGSSARIFRDRTQFADDRRSKRTWMRILLTTRDWTTRLGRSRRYRSYDVDYIAIWPARSTE